MRIGIHCIDDGKGLFALRLDTKGGPLLGVDLFRFLRELDERLGDPEKVKEALEEAEAL